MKNLLASNAPLIFASIAFFVAYGRTGGKYGKETEDYKRRLDEALYVSEKQETEKIIYLLVLMTEKAERQAMHARGTMAALWAILAYLVIDGVH